MECWESMRSRSCPGLRIERTLYTLYIFLSSTSHLPKLQISIGHTKKSQTEFYSVYLTLQLVTFNSRRNTKHECREKLVANRKGQTDSIVWGRPHFFPQKALFFTATMVQTIVEYVKNSSLICIKILLQFLCSNTNPYASATAKKKYRGIHGGERGAGDFQSVTVLDINKLVGLYLFWTRPSKSTAQVYQTLCVCFRCRHSRTTGPHPFRFMGCGPGGSCPEVGFLPSGPSCTLKTIAQRGTAGGTNCGKYDLYWRQRAGTACNKSTLALCLAG